MKTLVSAALGLGLLASAAQAHAVARGGHFGLVKHLDGHGLAVVDQGRKTQQRLLALFDFHQLGQLAKAPFGVAGIVRGSGRWRGLRSFFRSCLRWLGAIFRWF